MRKDFAAVVTLVLLFVVAAYSYVGITGNVVSGGDVVIENVEDSVVSKVDALFAMDTANRSIETMRENGFSIRYVSDQLLEANVVVSQLSYIEVINSANASYELKGEAYDALRLVNYKDISYEDVLVYTDAIEGAKKEAFELSDLLFVLEFQIDDFESDGVDVSVIREVQDSAYASFSEERYLDTRDIIDDVYVALEESVADRATSAILLRGIKGFLGQYWLYVLIFLLIFFLVIYLVWKKVKTFLIRKKIRHFNFEKQALEDLVVQTQDDRYKKKKISQMVYNIRYQKYMDKIDEIKQTIPVLEEKLNSKKIKRKA